VDVGVEDALLHGEHGSTVIKLIFVRRESLLSFGPGGDSMQAEIEH
jgi:hypothetical protein